MTEQESQKLQSVVSDTFGASTSITFEEDDKAILVEVKRAMVLVYSSAVEVDTSPYTVEGWSVGVLTAEGGFKELAHTPDFWTMAAAVVQSLSFQLVFDYRAQMQDSEEQYE